MTQQKIARMQCLHLEAGVVTRDEEPMADFISQELDGTDGGKFTAKLRICGVGAFRKNKPNAVVPGRFGMIAEHTNYAVAQVDGKTGKHATHFGVQGHERFHNERVRSLLFWFGGTRHGLCGLSEKTITD
jgi:hypothetical protein